MIELIDRIEAAPKGNWKLDAEIEEALGLDFDKRAAPLPFTNSIDTTIRMLLPEGWDWLVSSGGQFSAYAEVGPPRAPNVEGNAATPALALCAAVLKALKEAK